MLLPCTDLASHRLPVQYPPIEALPGQRAGPDFRHALPASIFRGVMHLEPSGQAGCLLGHEGLVEGGQLVRVQVVNHQDDVPFRKVNVGKVAEHHGEILPGAPVGDAGNGASHLPMHRAL